jgi:hypothetical protein
MAWWHKCDHCGDLDHSCYEVKCHLCGKDGWSNDFDFYGYVGGREIWFCDDCELAD